MATEPETLIRRRPRRRPPGMLTVPEAARIARVNIEYTYKQIERGFLKAERYQFPGTKRPALCVSPEAVEEWLALRNAAGESRRQLAEWRARKPAVKRGSVPRVDPSEERRRLLYEIAKQGPTAEVAK